jgi:hypothetical protein
VRFTVDPDVELFAASVRGSVGDWAPPTEPAFGTWWDERDDALAERLAAVGWSELGTDPDLLAAAVAGGIELGRALAPLCLLDEVTLGAPLAVEGRVRHPQAGARAAVVAEGGALLWTSPLGEGLEPEPTLDGTGTMRGAPSVGAPADDAEARCLAWGAVTLAYLAGVADAAVEQAIAHVSTREQFGAPLGRLPAVAGRLADAALARDGLALLAWAAVSDPARGLDALPWAGAACREATAQAVQVHGGMGFALEGGIHRHYRRAKTVQVWGDAVLAALGRG